jgi:uncharacterized protein (TIGR02453 family)
MPFSGFPPKGLEFLATLSRNNSAEWFHAHRVRYDEAVREPMVELVTSINLRLATFAPAYLARLPGAISRPNRDTRFSKDKAPYRTDISAVFPREGCAKQEAAGFFFRIAPEGIEVLGGVYVPGQPELDKLRQWIAGRHQELTRILAGIALRRAMGPLQGEQLQRVPREFPADHPAASLLRRKQWFLRATLPPAVATTKRLEQELATRFKLMTPFVTALDLALGNA